MLEELKKSKIQLYEQEKLLYQQRKVNKNNINIEINNSYMDQQFQN